MSTTDRSILLIRDQYPDLDIRLCFLSDGRLYKGSPTRYSAYCEKHGLRYAHKAHPRRLVEGRRHNP